MKEYILNAFDLVNITFQTEADQERVQDAFEYAQGLYENIKVHGGSISRDRLLAILLLGITDDLLQQKQCHVETIRRIENLLNTINNSTQENT